MTFVRLLSFFTNNNGHDVFKQQTSIEMPLKLEVINPAHYDDWDNILLSSPDCSFFHSSAWSKVLCETYNYKPNYFTLFDGNRLLALIPVIEINSILTGRRGVSLPFSDYCEPIIDKSVQFKDFLAQIIKHSKKNKWKYLELRGGERLLNDTKPAAQYLGHTLNLSQNEGQIFSSFRNSTVRNIKKAEKTNVDVKLYNSLDSIKQFYILNCMTRKQHGLPPQPFKFFKKVYDHIISKEMGFVVLASYQKKYIAGAVYFHFGEKALYKYGASDRSYQHMRANNLVMWEAIKWYCRNGYKNLCFGRTEAENQGLRQFKSGWGTKEHTVKYYKYNLLTDAFIENSQRIDPLYNKALSKMPIPLLKTMGTLSYKHMG